VAARVISVGADKNGRVVRLRRGQTAVVRLDFQFGIWGFHTSGAAVRQQGSPRIVYQTAGCLAARACGSVRLTLKAVATGKGAVSATRRICGEDYICGPKDRTFSVTFTVN
jgi:hypothetical protein